MCLLLEADLRLWPSLQMSAIQDPRKTWLATGSLLTVWWRMPVSEAEIAPCLLALAVCLSVSVRGKGLELRQLALRWYSINPLFFEPARLCLRLEPFMGKFSLSLFFFFFFSLATPQFGLPPHVSSLRLFSGNSDIGRWVLYH